MQGVPVTEWCGSPELPRLPPCLDAESGNDEKMYHCRKAFLYKTLGERSCAYARKQLIFIVKNNFEKHFAVAK
jgi:hypothetical protein